MPQLRPKEIRSLEIRPDPTANFCVGITYRTEYEPGEFATFWFAREMRSDHAEQVVAALKATLQG